MFTILDSSSILNVFMNYEENGRIEGTHILISYNTYAFGSESKYVLSSILNLIMNYEENGRIEGTHILISHL